MTAELDEWIVDSVLIRRSYKHDTCLVHDTLLGESKGEQLVSRGCGSEAIGSYAPIVLSYSEQ
jgi:hypothetical protein